MTRGLRLLVIGKQGSGKGTLCAQLSGRLGVPHVSTGDALRAAIAGGTELGEQAARFVSAGRLVPDDLVMEVVDELLVRDGLLDRGFLFDGFPRTVHQAELLDGLVAPEGIDAVIDLEVPDAVVLRRIATRRVCANPACGATYSLAAPPARNWTCDRCGSPVVVRDDDREEAVVRRLAAYEEMTAPLISRYALEGRLISVEAAGTADGVFAVTLRELADRGLIEPERAAGR